MKIAFVKHGPSLTPAYNRDRDNYAKLKDDVYEFEVKKARNLKHTRKYWAILGLVVANSEKWRDEEDLHMAIKRHLGYKRVVMGLDGMEFEQVGSIRHEVMDEFFFSKFYDAALPALAALIGVTVAELENNMGEYL